MAELFRLEEFRSAFSGLSNPAKWVVAATTCYTAFRLTTDLVIPLLQKPFRLVVQANKHDPASSEFDKDKFYLHIFPRSCTKQVLNLSPFAVKVETWLRLKKIKYEVRKFFVITFQLYKILVSNILKMFQMVICISFQIIDYIFVFI